MTDKKAMSHIAANVAMLRGTRSRGWLARATGTYAINITRIERSEHMPGAGLLSRLAEALEVTPDVLLDPPKKKFLQKA